MAPQQAPKPRKISHATIRRLSLYHRTLDILESAGVQAVSSHKLGQIEGINPAQVRKDLSAFGSFGHRGFGYGVAKLKRQIAKILGLHRRWHLVLIGAGQLGNVFLSSEAFKRRNLLIAKIFDDAPELIGKRINGVTVSHMDKLEQEIDPETDVLAIIAVSPSRVQSIIDRLGKIGVKGALYFAGRAVSAPRDMVVLNQDISVELGTLTYHVKSLMGLGAD
jgi:redox-sensing transcriptional repressor